MWVGAVNYDRVTAYLSGYDYALDGGFLAGFKEWLAVKYGYGQNLAWNGLFASATLGEADTHERPRPTGHDEVLLEQLRSTLVEFLRHRQIIGLRNVLFDHGQWMRKQDWFDENVERFGSSAGPATEQGGAPDAPTGAGDL